MFKYILGGLSALVLSACVYSVDFAEPYNAAVEVQYFGDDYCSGVMVEQDAVTVTVLTAGHCTQTANIANLTIVTETCGTMSVTSSMSERLDTDVGMIIAIKNNNCIVETADIADEVVIGEPVVAVGFPAPLGKTVSFGYLSSLNAALEGQLRFNSFQIAGAPGSSGSGIFNSDGDVIGILTGPAVQSLQLVRGSTIEDIKAFLDAQ